MQKNKTASKKKKKNLKEKKQPLQEKKQEIGRKKTRLGGCEAAGEAGFCLPWAIINPFYNLGKKTGR